MSDSGNRQNHHPSQRGTPGIAWSISRLSYAARAAGVLVCLFAFGDCQRAEAQTAESLWTRSQGQDWPTFLGSATDGVSRETGILKDWSEGRLKVLWKAPTGEGYGMGSAAQGRFLHFGRYDGRAVLKCFQAETGTLLWEFEYGSDYRDLYGYDSGPRASPVVDGDRVYIFGVEGMLHCLQVADGKLLWKVNTSERFGVVQNFFGVASTPVIVGEQLIVMVGGSPAASQKVPPGRLDLVEPNGTGIVAFDKKTGAVNYQVVNDLASYSSLKVASADALESQFGTSTLVLAWMRAACYGIDPTDGRVVFEHPYRSRKLESVNAATPVVKSDAQGNLQVLLSECYELGSVLLSLEKGEVRPVWSDAGRRGRSLEAHWNTPVVIGDFVYGCSGRHAGPAELRCVEWATGKVRWKQAGLARSSVLAIDGHLVVLGEGGDLLLVRATPEKFDVISEYKGPADVRFRAPCWAAPIVSHGLLYVRGKNQLVCFELIPEGNK